MTVNPNFSPSKGMWDGTTLNIPGLLPVDIGSPNPYPVTSWGQQRVTPPQTVTPGDYSQGYGAPSNGQIYGPTNDGTFAGSDGNPGSTGTRTADALFALMGLTGGAGGYGASGGGSPASSYGFAPSYGQDNLYASTPGGSPVDPMAGWRAGDVTSMPLAPIGSGSQSGQGYFDRIGSGISDKINSIAHSPNIDTGNMVQGAINAGGLFSPLVSIAAGIAQGTNMLPFSSTTGNALADYAVKPGFLQSLVADGTNFFDRLLGGEHMPIDPTVMGPNPDGSAYGSSGVGNGGMGDTGGGVPGSSQTWLNNLIADTSAMSPQGYLNFGMGRLGTGDMGGGGGGWGGGFGGGQGWGNQFIQPQGQDGGEQS